MEDGRAIYERPFDPARPVICLDETSRQLLAEARPPLAAAPGGRARRDPEDVRGGVAKLFLVTAPLRGWRAVLVTQQRTWVGFARCVKDLVAVHDPAAERIVLVLDQLNTYSPAALSAAFPPAAARRLAEHLAEQLEIHYTPTQGRWLNIAELELSGLQRQCLRGRLAARATMEREAVAWAGRRNIAKAAVAWRFTTADARTKLKRLYPAFEP